MDKLKKVGLTALGTALVASSASAGSLSVSGTAQLTFTGQEHADVGNTWTSSNSIQFSGSGELDNGMTISYTQNHNNGTTDNYAIGIGMGDMGTLTFGHGLAGGPVSAWDDKLPSANEESYHGVTGVTGPDGGYSSDESFKYTVDVMEGLQFHGGYQPAAAGQIGSALEYGLAYTGVEGLNIGIATGENDATANTVEDTVLYATYSMDAFTIGVQDNSTDTEAANGDSDFRGYGVSYAVSEDISVSYAMTSVEYENSSLEDQEATGLSFSYTSGGMTVSASFNEVDNVAGTSTNDRSAYEINFGFAF